MIRKPESPPPTDDPLTIIRQGINAALRVLVVGKSVSAFDAQRRLYAALRAVEVLERERINNQNEPKECTSD